ncbi:hypothetical protein BHM03_00012277 [Ensete ventricosum]|nr:hypothetical protein BHM03_00012277 [Ensete ventricosum]
MEGLQHTRAMMGKRWFDDVPTKQKGSLGRGEREEGVVALCTTQRWEEITTPLLDDVARLTNQIKCRH